MGKLSIAIIGELVVYAEGMRKIILENVLDPEVFIYESVEGFFDSHKTKKNAEFIILFVNGPFKNVFRDINFLSSSEGSIKLILICSKKCWVYIHRLNSDDIKGFIDFEESVSHIKNGINMIISGKYFISDSLCELVLREKVIGNPDNPFDRLSDVEFMVAEELYFQKKYKILPAEFSLTSKAVVKIQLMIFKKLEIKNSIAEFRKTVEQFTPFFFQPKEIE